MANQVKQAVSAAEQAATTAAINAVNGTRGKITQWIYRHPYQMGLIGLGLGIVLTLVARHYL